MTLGAAAEVLFSLTAGVCLRPALRASNRLALWLCESRRPERETRYLLFALALQPVVLFGGFALWLAPIWRSVRRSAAVTLLLPLFLGLLIERLVNRAG